MKFKVRVTVELVDGATPEMAEIDDMELRWYEIETDSAELAEELALDRYHSEVAIGVLDHVAIDCQVVPLPAIDWRESVKLGHLRIKQVAGEVYATFDKNERVGVKFGMFPARKMEEAQKKLDAEFADDPRMKRDVSRLLAVGIMDAANAGADKVVV